MSGFILLCGILALVYVLYWMIQNDAAPSIEDQRGLLQMALPKVAAAVAGEEAEPADRSRDRKRSHAPGPAKPAPAAVDRLTLEKRSGSSRKAASTRSTGDASEDGEIVHPLWRGRRRPTPPRS